jgi:RNA 3'-terminal phosphate cyclase
VQDSQREHFWSAGPAAYCGVSLRQLTPSPMFVSLGDRGKSAESVADDAADEAIAFLTSGACVDPHAADQILLPLAFAERSSEYQVSEVTQHLLTNIETIHKFLDRPIRCEGVKGDVGTVVVG